LRLAPDGDHVFISHSDSTTYASQFIEFKWNGTTLEKGDVYAAPHDYQYGELFDISTPSRGPDRHIVYSDYNYTTAKTEIVEIADGGGKFVEVARYPLEELGDSVMQPMKPSLSADGLRLVFLNTSYVAGGGVGYGTNSANGADLGGGGGWCGYSNNVVMYTDRPNPSAHFGPAQVIDTVPDQVDWPYMTEDCGRIYLSALNRIFYFKQ
jgi:hypothetical protein